MKTINQLLNNCFGCGVCSQVCPVNAITMSSHEDKSFFIYPKINQSLCINCGKCYNQCPQTIESNKISIKETFIYKGNELSMMSASGGAFADLARYFLSIGGVVYGACWNGLKVKHDRIVDNEDLSVILSSKYVQSAISKDIWFQLKKDIQSNKKVLFSGTPCQTMAAKAFFGGAVPKNLFLIDIICHGVPSQDFFDKNIAEEQKKYNIKIIDFKFRYKISTDGQNKLFRYSYERKGKLYFKVANNVFFPYYKEFQKNEIFRDCCYTCKYKQGNTTSAITIGDPWFLQKVSTGIKEYGNSLIVINDNIGKDLVKLLDSERLLSISNNILCFNDGYNFSTKKQNFDLLNNNETIKKLYKKPIIIVIVLFLIKNGLKHLLNFFLKKKYTIYTKKEANRDKKKRELILVWFFLDSYNRVHKVFLTHF